MLISLQHRFIFVASLKTGSTAIETMLGPLCEARITDTTLGKHDSLAEIETRFPLLYRDIPREQFLVFGAMREPLDLLMSLYRSHTKPEFAGTPVYCGGMSLARFAAEWLPANAWQWTPQWTRFRNRAGAYDCDLLLDYARLQEHFDLAMSLLGLPPCTLPVENESPPGPSAEDLDPTLAERLLASRAHDAQLLREFGGRLRRVPQSLAAAL